ncbi:glycosyltransferase family 2 protein [Schleiferiaceae bacterium]|nr:glycosyltransferase family 2 protein [Schleiferiaceae bacterium]
MSTIISVIIPCYNRENHISRAIRSCLEQTLSREDFEIIVIDDGSTDHSLREINKFKEQITLITHGANLGLPSARNAGIQVSKGRYVFNLDSDDYMHPETLKTMLLAITLTNSPAVSCDYIFVDNLDNRSNQISAVDHPIACGILFKRELLIEIGLYDVEFLINEEKDLRYRFDEKYRITHIPIPFYRYLQHEDNLTKSKKKIIFDKKLKQKHS